MNKPTIYDIKYMTIDTSPYFFTRDTLRFFGQTMRSFGVYNTDDDNKYLISAKTKTGSYTKRLFVFDDRKKNMGHLELLK